LDHVSVVVDDLAAAIAFFTALTREALRASSSRWPKNSSEAFTRQQAFAAACVLKQRQRHARRECAGLCLVSARSTYRDAPGFADATRRTTCAAYPFPYCN
jgi:hypothetical protein